MSRSLPFREAPALLASMLLGVAATAATGQAPVGAQPAPAASRLPAYPPTSSQPSAALASQAVSTGGAHQPRLDVTYADGKLTVNAANASLNQVVQDIVQKTGMKVSGGVSEERVFGHYGPSPVAEVLTALLEGTGNNILLVDNQSGPSSLVLTPRQGLATPANPNAAIAQSDSQDPQEPQEQYVPPIRPFQPPRAIGRGPVGANADGSPAPDPTSPSESNFVPSQDNPKTPQQIFDQLQSLAAQQPPAPEE